jgi:hypothetical protein
MASSIIEITINWDVVKDGIRRELITGGFGQLWEDYCWQNNVPADIKLGFLDYLAAAPDSLFNEEE